jgi:hypothetical protein
MEKENLRKESFLKSQELREMTLKNSDEPIAFLRYYCKCGEGIAVFDSETRMTLMRFSDMDKRDIQTLYKELCKARNKLNRKISALKKVDLKN